MENFLQFATPDYFDQHDENRDFEFKVENKSMWISSKDLCYHSPVSYFSITTWKYEYTHSNSNFSPKLLSDSLLRLHI